MVVPAGVEATRMGTTTVSAATLADTQDLETILHPTPTGMTTLGLEHEVDRSLHSYVHTRVPVLCFHIPVFLCSIRML